MAEPWTKEFMRRFLGDFVNLQVVTIAIYLVTVPAWSSYVTGVGYHAILAFLAIVCADALLIQSREDPSPVFILLLSAFLFSSITNISGAAEQLFAATPPLFLQTAARTGANLMDLGLVGVMLLAAASLRYRFPQMRRRAAYALAISLALVSLLIREIVLYIMFAMPWTVYIVAYSFGVVALSAFIVSGVLLCRRVSFSRQTDRIRVLMGPVTLALSAVPLLLTLNQPSSLWTLSLIQQVGGFFVLYMALMMPSLRGVGLTRRSMYGVVMGLSLLVVVPFLTTLGVEVVMPGFRLVDLGAYTMSQLGIAVISGVMAFLMLSYSRKKPAWYHNPLILLFLTQATVETYLIVIALISDVGGSMPVAAYIVGSTVVSAGLLLAIRWTSKPPDKESRPVSWVSRSFVVVLLILLIVEVVHLLVTSSAPQLLGYPLGRAILLSINLANVFGFVYLFMTLLRLSAGTYTVEEIAVTFLALWIVPNILRSINDRWTAGWWAGEFLLLLVLLGGPAFLGSLYMRSYLRAETSQKRATLYADILVHDMANYHQAVLSALDLLDYQGIPEDIEARAKADARLALTRAVQLAKNVRQLSKVEASRRVDLHPVDLSISIADAINQTATLAPDLEAHILFDHNERFYVEANNLLTDLFLNLFRNAVQYSPNEKRIDVEIMPVTYKGKDCWQIRVCDYGSGIDPDTKKRLFSRFMEGASGTGIGLSVVGTLTDFFGGQVAVEDRVPGAYARGTVFVVTLPVAVYPNLFRTGLRKGLERAMHAVVTGLIHVVILAESIQARLMIDFLKDVALPSRDLRVCDDTTLSPNTFSKCDIASVTLTEDQALPPSCLILDITRESTKGGTQSRFFSNLLERTRGFSYQALMSTIREEMSLVLDATGELTACLSLDKRTRDERLYEWRRKFTPEKKALVYDIIQGRSRLGHLLWLVSMRWPPSIFADADERLVLFDGRIMVPAGLANSDMEEIEKKLMPILDRLLGPETLASLKVAAGFPGLST